ncbi:MAG: radical SAM protein [Candidatus Lernaella stagnicola]|nr:radical SAM protein [Candidatus Lernaella stagnicola]
MNLLFLNPPRFFDTWPIPLDAARDFCNIPSVAFPLLARLAPEGTNVSFFDGFNESITRRQFIELIQRQDIVAMKSINSRGALGVEIAMRLIRQYNPRAKIILGGPHATAYPEPWVERGADAVFRHEAETEFTKLIETLAGDGDLSRVRGITYRDNGSMRNNPDAPFLENLDDSPPPDWSICNLSLYNANLTPHSRSGKSAAIEFSRGCTNHCAFCFVPYFWKNRQRRKSAARVLDEITELQARGVDEAGIVDDNFGVYAKRDREIFEELARRGAPIKFHAFVRADSILRDPELFELAGRGGLARILVGYESLTDEGLEYFNKGYPPGFTVAQHPEVYEITRRAGIFLYANFIVNSGQPFTHDLRVFMKASKISDGFGTTNWEPHLFTDLERQARDEQMPIKDSFYNFIHLSHFHRDSVLRRSVHILVAVASRVWPQRLWRAWRRQGVYLGETKGQLRLLVRWLFALRGSRLIDFLICQSSVMTSEEKEKRIVARNLERLTGRP